MSVVSPSPRRVTRPRWLDVRLALGVLLVLGAVLIGAQVFAHARHTGPELAVTRDLAAGTTVQAADVRVIEVQLPGSANVYVRDEASAIGKVLTQPLPAGALVPATALGATPELTTVSMPLSADAAPRLSRGQRIVVWLSTAKCPSAVLLRDVTVQDSHAASSGVIGAADGGQAVVLSVSPQLAARVVTALAFEGATVRAGVLSGGSATRADDAATDLPDLAACAPTR
jgi:ABC-type uncharacterized transport system permease subunit